MVSKEMTRRRYLLTAGTALSTALAGCQTGATNDDGTTTDTTTSPPTSTTSGDENATTSSPTDDELPTDTSPDDGYPPTFENPPEPVEFDSASFPTRSMKSSSGATVEVPLIPLDIAYNLYARGETRMVDSRDRTGYQISHILGSISSPAPGGSTDDPTGNWNKSDPVIVYCHCPIHLAIQRAANLLDNGFKEVYALQGGYQAWKVANHPTDGQGVPATAKTWTIEGTTDASDAGGIAYVYHKATDQVAGTKINADGSYSLKFAFASVSGSDETTVGTPSYEVDGPLQAFTNETVTADSGGANDSTATNSTSANSTDDDGSAYSAFGRLVGGRVR